MESDELLTVRTMGACDRYDAMADLFHRTAHRWAPGRSIPLDVYDGEEESRQAQWSAMLGLLGPSDKAAWCASWLMVMREAESRDE